MSKVTFRIAKPLLVFIVAVASASGIAQSISAPHPDSGNFVGNTYTNDYFGLKYELDNSWYVNQEIIDQDARHSPKLAGRFLLTVLDRHTGGPMRERVLIMADDPKVYTAFDGVRDYVAKLVNAWKQQGYEVTRAISEAEFGGAKFFRGDFNEKYPDGVLYKSLLSTERDGFFLSWTFVASSPDRLDTLIESLSKLTFRLTDHASGKASAIAVLAVPEKRVRISQMTLEKYILEKPVPLYPDDAKKAGTQGRVTLHVVLNDKGEIEKLEILHGDSVFAKAALDGVRYWKFRPYLLNGEPVGIDSQITIDFKLP